MMIIGGEGNLPNKNSIIWYCPDCLNLLKKIESVDLADGFNEFIQQFQLEAVRTFNASQSDRTCDKCGRIHPEAYGFDQHSDDEHERLSREKW